MDALEFINLNLKYGQRVQVTLGERTYKGYFGGYKCFEGSHSCLEYALYPIFYAIGKKGQMVTRSMVPERTPYWGLSTIKEVKAIKAQYKHVAYINNYSDCYDASLRGPETVLNDWKKKAEGKNQYAFYDPDNNELFEDLENEKNVTFLEGGRYVVKISVFGKYPQDEETITRGDCPWFVDVYELVNE